MGLDESFNEIIKFSLAAPLRDKKALKYFAFIFVFIAVVGLVSNYFTLSAFRPLVENPGLASDPAAATSILVQFFSYFGAIMLLYVVVLYAMEYLLLARALELSGKRAQTASPKNVARLIVLSVAQGLCAVFSAFKPKMLLIGAAGLALLALGIALASVAAEMPAALVPGGMLALLGGLALIAYGAVIIYNALRLVVSAAAFVEKGLSVKESLKFSWKATKGSVFNIFLIGLVLGIILGIINMCLSFPAMAYSLLAAIFGATQIGIMADPAYLALMIPAYLGSAFVTTAMMFFLASLYKHLLAEKKVSSAPATGASFGAKPKAKKKAKKK